MVIIFDFDGTMADSFSIIRDLFNENAPKYGVRPIKDEEEWQKIRRMSFRQLLDAFDVKARQIPKYLVIAKKLLLKDSDKIKLFPGITEQIIKIYEEGNQLFVLSSNSEEVVSRVLNKHGILDKMTIMKSSRLFGKSQAVKKLIKQNKLVSEEVWLVGDETRDLEAAYKAGIKSIGVTWGFHPSEVLETKQPTLLVSEPVDILESIKAYEAREQ